MSTLEMDTMLVFRNWKLLLKVGLSGLLIWVVIFVMMASKSHNVGTLAPILLLFLAMYPAYQLSFAQKEILNGAFSWSLPGLLPRFFRAQLVWVFLTAFASWGLVAMVGSAPNSIFDAWGAAQFLSFGCLAGIVYVMMALSVFRFESSAYFPFGMFFILLFLPKPIAGLDINVLPLMGEFGIFIGALVLMVLFLRSMMLKKSMQRSFCGRLILTSQIAISPSRMTSFKAIKDQKPGAGDFSQRPAGKILTGLVDRIAESQARQKYVQSHVLSGLLMFFSTLPRSRWGYTLTLLFFPFWLLVSGYMDGTTTSSLDRWFSSLSFLFFAYLPGMLAYSLVGQTLVLQCRKTREKAGFQTAAWLAVASVGSAGMVWLLLKLLEFSLPVIVLDGKGIAFLAPHPEMILSSLFVLPFALVAVSKFKPARLHMNFISMTFFYVYLVLFSINRGTDNGGIPWIIPAVLVALFMVLMVMFIVLWKKRCQQWDQ